MEASRSSLATTSATRVDISNLLDQSTQEDERVESLLSSLQNESQILGNKFCQQACILGLVEEEQKKNTHILKDIERMKENIKEMEEEICLLPEKLKQTKNDEEEKRKLLREKKEQIDRQIGECSGELDELRKNYENAQEKKKIAHDKNESIKKNIELLKGEHKIISNKLDTLMDRFGDDYIICQRKYSEASRSKIEQSQAINKRTQEMQQRSNDLLLRGQFAQQVSNVSTDVIGKLKAEIKIVEKELAELDRTQITIDEQAGDIESATGSIENYCHRLADLVQALGRDKIQ